MNLEAALNLSWERLELLARAYRRRDARTMIEFMVAAQGDAKSWAAQQKRLFEMLK